ncbi:single-stranded DNA-binding protein [Sphaerisporangium sp. NPDC005289]|uniref:single-stranded DNA-binding protein n=1 Tax=Sphaerisporangium sp. NPDC005289 TaxID=3155247 RepID=UPI0033A800EA
MHRNEVTLVGRLSKPARRRELPSGDVMTMWGLAVRRPAEHPSGKKADGIACVTFDPEVGARVAGWRVDDVVTVEGALHQRYRGGAGGGASTYEVEVREARRLQARDPGRRDTAAPSPTASAQDHADGPTTAAEHRPPVRHSAGDGMSPRQDGPSDAPSVGGEANGHGAESVGGEGAQDEAGAGLGAE